MKCDKLVDVGRRQFLRGGALATAGVAVVTVAGGSQAKATPANARVDLPDTKLANIKDLKVNDPMDISYPDGDSPGILLRLGQKVEGGIGPNGDIVAYSVLCPHMGFPLSYNKGDKSLNCPGHYSRFDVEAEGQEIWGHSTQNLAKFTLWIDDKGDIYANGADELIYGRLTNNL